MITEDDLKDRLGKMQPSVLAALLRIGRRVGEGFDGEISILVKHGGIASIRWAQTENGDVIKGELG